ncbi:MAG: sugar-binding domain-containing protein, partial [Planctomycetota bacterium]
MIRFQESLTQSPWRFCPDPHGDGEALGFHQPDWSAATWATVTVPSCFEAGCPSLDSYEGRCWYRTSFTVNNDWQGKRIVLHFGAVNYRARVWLNGKLLGSHRDGFLPFSFAIQTALNPGGENLLAVEVDNRHHEGDVPG